DGPTTGSADVASSRPRGRIAVVAGTRPEIIKLAPVVAELERRFSRGRVLVIDTGQHYDQAMSGQFWGELGPGHPDVRLQGGGMSRAGCIGSLTAALGGLFSSTRPSAVVVQGDTNSTLAGALAANAEGIPLVHVEAGLRSYDRAMPEEHNRVMVDHLADLCCAPTLANATNLLAEQIPEHHVSVTGNTVIEAVQRQLPAPAARRRVLETFGLEADRFLLATVHRPENTDDPEALAAILMSLDLSTRRLPVVLPLHPRTALAVERSGLSGLLQHLVVLPPLGSSDFLALAAHALVIVSDSGGLAEEVTVLKRPLVVVRRSTERAEAVEAGFARMAAPTAVAATVDSMLQEHRSLLDRLAHTASPFGDGTASTRITDRIAALVTEKSAVRV
ncbi:MAG TPA: UDP-N-acetylglucosamine 2-epimerase (non-hydrolyzing), partial [Acidimicrobiales bacterium]|nr:UDP-N-acetylglucosamine 2-epimerase (non-hydrolyzing) [Acidimicrobiales bacterium]